MRYLIVYCHPRADSFNHALFRCARGALEAAGHEVRCIDLYAEGFDPVLGPEERAAYHTKGVNEEPVRAHLDQLFWAEGIVLVFPTWWYGLPAMLKGWLDRVWVPHATFVMPDDGGPIRPGMTHITRLVGITTCGAPWLWTKIVGEPGRKTVMRGIRALCAKRCKTTWLAHYLMDASTPKSRAAFLKKVEKKLVRL